MKKKPKSPKLRRFRNPFAGRPRSGAGFHGEKKYGKKDRRREKKQLEETEED